MQDWATQLVAGKSWPPLTGQQLPFQGWPGSLSLQQSGPQLPRGGSRVRLGCHRGNDSRGCGGRQWKRGGVEVWTLWAQMKHCCEDENTMREWLPPVCQRGLRQEDKAAQHQFWSLHLLAEWDWKVNAANDWHADQVTLGSQRKVHWIVQHECKPGLVHRWQATPQGRIARHTGSPSP